MQEFWTQIITENTDATNVERLESIQSLWSGYGEIFRVQLLPEKLGTRVIKQVTPQSADNNPRGWNTDNSTQRKIRSYEIEAYWYTQWSTLCNEWSRDESGNSRCRVPACDGCIKKDLQSWIVLEDLDASGYYRRHSHLNIEQAKTCLHWLANFHACFLGKSPEGLWPTGTYWHLHTRPDEFNSMESGRLKDSAILLDQLLDNCTYKTIVHGDAKVANFCFSENDQQVAAVDFQYTGGGCGMKDVAYFLGSCFDEEECDKWVPSLLDFYFEVLIDAVSDKNIDSTGLEQEWRAMFAPAWTDFHRFLLGWMPQHKKIHRYTQKLTDLTLKNLAV